MDELSRVIACIGWGSLVWRPGTLPVIGKWALDGPELPVEFARQSQGGPLTLVLLPSARLVRTLWAKLNVPDLENAARELRKREGTSSAYIDRTPGGSSNEFAQRIRTWAEQKGLAGAVWTALPPKFDDENYRVPSEEEALDYLGGLTGEQRRDAEKYVRMAPAPIQTPYRAAFERELGWAAETPI